MTEFASLPGRQQHREFDCAAEEMQIWPRLEPGRIVLDEKPIPDVGPLDALVRVTTMICAIDGHIYCCF